MHNMQNPFSNYGTNQLQTMLNDCYSKLNFVVPNSQDHIVVNNNIVAIQAVLQERSMSNGYIVPQQQQPAQYQPSVINNMAQNNSYGISGVNPYNMNYNEPVGNNNANSKRFGKYDNKMVENVVEQKAPVVQPTPVETYTTVNYDDKHPIKLVKFENIEGVPYRLAMTIPNSEDPLSNVLSYNVVDAKVHTIKPYKGTDEDPESDETIDFKDLVTDDLAYAVKFICNDTGAIGNSINKRLTKFVNKSLKYMVSGGLDYDIATDIVDLMNIENTVTDIDVKLKLKVLKEALLEKLTNISLELKSKITDKTSLVTGNISFLLLYGKLDLKPNINNWIVSDSNGALYKALDTISKETGFNTMVLVCDNKEYDIIKYHECYIILGEML